MNLVLLTETIVKMIVNDVEAASAREYESTEENVIHFLLRLRGNKIFLLFSLYK